MRRFKNIITGSVCLILFQSSFGQEEDKSLHLTTGVGVNEVAGELGKAFRSTIAFNSGFERPFGKKWYAQLEFNFNSLRYDQKVKDENSPYLFQNTNSSLFMIGLNWGRDFKFNNSPWFTSAYLGSGYLNIGKPRVNLDEINNIITQSVVRKSGIIGRAGGRVGIKTNSALLQTLYFDGSYLTSSLKADGSVFRSISIFVGMKMAMSKDSRPVNTQMKAIRRLK
ncbi:MAG TPA: hypothetical protein VFP97_02495 [Chitinophagaceae bacterium]|nr:hypothetical protein [Chitinophagaceae bacterium]